MIFKDEFNSDSGNEAVGAYVDSSKSVSSGRLNVAAGAGGAGTSAWTKTNFNCLNASITVQAVGTAAIPQIHLRQTDQNNYLVAYLDPNDGTINIGKVSGGVYTSLGSTAGAITSGGTFTFSAKVFGNALMISERVNTSAETIYKKILYIGSDVASYTGTRHGLGATSGTQKYEWVDMRELLSFTNVVCVGDSNVGADNASYWPNVMMKRRFFEGFWSTNQGTGGYSTQDIYDERTTRVDPYLISGADNIVSIATGNNDYAKESKTYTQAYDVQKTLISYCQGLGYRVELATLIPFPYADRGGYTSLQFVDGLNTLIRGGYSTYRYSMCEVHNPFGATDGQYGVVPSDLVNADEIHYSTASGHPLAAQIHLKNLATRERLPV